MSIDKLLFNPLLNTLKDAASIVAFIGLIVAVQSSRADPILQIVGFFILGLLVLDRVIVLEMRLLAGPLIDRWLDIYMRSLGRGWVRILLDVVGIGCLMLASGYVIASAAPLFYKIILLTLLFLLVVATTWLLLLRLWVRSNPGDTE